MFLLVAKVHDSAIFKSEHYFGLKYEVLYLVVKKKANACVRAAYFKTHSSHKQSCHRNVCLCFRIL
jgi:hypothetical protein